MLVRFLFGQASALQQEINDLELLRFRFIDSGLLCCRSFTLSLSQWRASNFLFNSQKLFIHHNKWHSYHIKNLNFICNLICVNIMFTSSLSVPRVYILHDKSPDKWWKKWICSREPAESERHCFFSCFPFSSISGKNWLNFVHSFFSLHSHPATC